MTKKETCDYYVEEDDEEQTPLDQFGNRMDGTTMEWCCSPDCGCPEARLCMASRGAYERYSGTLIPVYKED